ncbi:hypothetical protein [Clostridioides difficile]|uniref:hypothetical protein n=1 Tax=Clostridioides difficile TaxID=1496 RepID=UPI003F7A8D9C
MYQKLYSLHKAIEGISQSTASTNEVTTIGAVPLLHGFRLDIRGTHGGLGKSVQGISQPWREWNFRQQKRATTKVAKQEEGGRKQ